MGQPKGAPRFIGRRSRMSANRLGAMTAGQPQRSGIDRGRFFVAQLVIRSSVVVVALALGGVSVARGRWVAVALEGFTALLALHWVDRLRRTSQRLTVGPMVLSGNSEHDRARARFSVHATMILTPFGAAAIIALGAEDAAAWIFVVVLAPFAALAIYIWLLYQRMQRPK